MYYQVHVSFELDSGKPSLSDISLHSSLVFSPNLFGSYTSLLSHCRYFHTLKDAHHYINYLYSRHPNYTAPRPKLDELQLTLF